jgi:hypothetical protein
MYQSIHLKVGTSFLVARTQNRSPRHSEQASFARRREESPWREYRRKTNAVAVPLGRNALLQQQTQDFLVVFVRVP